MSSRLAGAWALRQARNFAMDLGRRIETFKFLIHDRDPIFTRAFNGVFEADDLKIIWMAAHAPWMNAYCERVIGTLRSEFLDKILIVNERRLTTVLAEYLIHYNGHRPHRSRQQRPSEIDVQPTQPAATVTDLSSIRRKADLSYTGAAATLQEPWGSWQAPAFEVIADAQISALFPANRLAYEGRSHSLWYCDAQEEGSYEWFETAFMISPFIPQMSRIDPFALDPGVESAKALGNGTTEYQAAWPFSVLSFSSLEEFIDRWAGWFAAAAQGRLPHPPAMPERHAEGSWRS